MKLASLNNVIATRTLTVLSEPGSAVEVLLGKPEPDAKDFYCPYQIKGAGTEKVRCVYGVDAFQALQLALSTLRVELEALNNDLGGTLRWECDDKGELGFPAFVGFP
jgi:hypothetical protein